MVTLRSSLQYLFFTLSSWSHFTSSFCFSDSGIRFSSDPFGSGSTSDTVFSGTETLFFFIFCLTFNFLKKLCLFFSVSSVLSDCISSASFSLLSLLFNLFFKTIFFFSSANFFSSLSVWFSSSFSSSSFMTNTDSCEVSSSSGLSFSTFKLFLITVSFCNLFFLILE